MGVRKSKWLVAMMVGAVGLVVACGSAAESTPKATAQDYMQRFYDGDLADLHKLFTPEFSRQIPFAGFSEMHRSVEDQLGAEVQLVSEDLTTKSPYHRYVRRARFERFAGEIEISWVLREDDLSIAGLVFSPVEPPAAAPTP